MRHASSPRPLIHRRCGWLLWLALLLLPLTQSALAWHSYSHDAAATSESSDKHAKHDQAHCDICLAAAAINGAPPSPPLLSSPVAHDPPPQDRVASLWFASLHRSYSSRAPPFAQC